MTWTYSQFGERLSGPSGINELMRDLGAAMSGGRDVLMLGGGNPAHLPEVEAVWRSRWREIYEQDDQLERTLGNYDGPQGHPPFIEALAESLVREYGWDIRPENIAVVNGSQNAFFYLFNMLAGAGPEERHKHIALPLSPEYIGYADQPVFPGVFRSTPPLVEMVGDRFFKYHIDFNRLQLDASTAALCVSRPTNPTGNVLTNEEIEQLEALAARHHVPLIIDNAYGAPFPDILFKDIRPVWSEHTVLVMSLSKLGLPGTRTGIILAREELIESIAAMNAVVGLANGNIGQVIATPLLRDGRLYDLSRDVIRPYYERKSRQAIQWITEALDPALPYRIHVSEGALFLWLWLDGLPITAEILYQRLKARGVLVIPGHYFFYGLEEEHPHQHQCLRISYAMSEDVVQRGVAILAEEVARAYAGAGAMT
ncbi:MAG TPA: valine--pyruvate transaminase [Kiritimatiellia bacterium]|nr:valine--pyruvate transaminase [Kiritimatiellia bacterium]HMO98759.1 valine--pyruvate transaminase [Kiritimatiellia bacterium]HMP95935.1 valine--pyruvate transaminase [Kiritimatiellia bacterium]